MGDLPTRERVQRWLDEPGLDQYGHGAVGGLMKAYAEGHLIDGQAIADAYESYVKSLNGSMMQQSKSRAHLFRTIHALTEENNDA